MTKDDGGPAFPVLTRLTGVERSTPDYQAAGIDGMSLRDYFAAKALAGILQVPDLCPASEEEMGHLAMRVYQVADAMLAERAKVSP